MSSKQVRGTQAADYGLGTLLRIPSPLGPTDRKDITFEPNKYNQESTGVEESVAASVEQWMSSKDLKA